MVDRQHENDVASFLSETCGLHLLRGCFIPIISSSVTLDTVRLTIYVFDDIAIITFTTKVAVHRISNKDDSLASYPSPSLIEIHGFQEITLQYVC